MCPGRHEPNWLAEQSRSVVKDMGLMLLMPNGAEACRKGVCCRFAHTGLGVTESVSGS